MNKDTYITELAEKTKKDLIDVIEWTLSKESFEGEINKDTKKDFMNVMKRDLILQKRIKLRLIHLIIDVQENKTTLTDLRKVKQEIVDEIFN